MTIQSTCHLNQPIKGDNVGKAAHFKDATDGWQAEKPNWVHGDLPGQPAGGDLVETHALSLIT